MSVRAADPAALLRAVGADQTVVVGGDDELCSVHASPVTSTFEVPPPAVPLLITLYGGALFTLVTSPRMPGGPTAHDLAQAIVAGALAATAGDGGTGDGPARPA